MTDTTTRPLPTRESAGPWTPSKRERRRRRTRRWRRAGRVVLAVLTTVVVVGGIGVGVAFAPGWPRVRELFFDLDHARDALPAVLEGLWLDVRVVLLAAPLALLLGVALALLRHTRSVLLVPVRGLAVVLTDLVRGVPPLLLVFVCVLGIPALDLRGTPQSPLVWAVVALVLVHTASVAVILRTALGSIPRSQLVVADALALSRGQTLRHVVLPQALRRAGPPLLHELVALQKNAVLVAAVAVGDALLAAAELADTSHNYTPYVVAALCFAALTLPFVWLGDGLARRAEPR